LALRVDSLRRLSNKMNLATPLLSKDESEACHWIEVDGLPDCEGEPIWIEVESPRVRSLTLDEIKAACEDDPMCVGFAYHNGSWHPKRTGTGFQPCGNYSQKHSGESWQWHYIRSRAEADGRSEDEIARLQAKMSEQQAAHQVEVARLKQELQRAQTVADDAEQSILFSALTLVPSQQRQVADLEAGQECSPTQERRKTGAARSQSGCCCRCFPCPSMMTEFATTHKDEVQCLTLSAVRLSCSWCLKLTILYLCVASLFLLGPLSRPMWVPISKSKACEKSKDALPSSPNGKDLWQSLEDCEAACERRQDCQAIDYYHATNWCNYYATPCAQPTAVWDGASSFQMAVSCRLTNGTQGILIAGHCTLGIVVPSTWSVICSEAPALLHSPFSWSLSIAVTLIYAYLVSSWFRQLRAVQQAAKVAVCASQPVLKLGRCWYRWMYGGGWPRKLMLMIVLAIAWFGATVHWFGLPPTSAGKLPRLPLSEYAWLSLSIVVFFLAVCKGCRSVVVNSVLCIGSGVMNVFLSCAGCALSACFDTAALGIGGLAEAVTGASLFTAALVPEGTAVGGGLAEAALAADGLTATEAGFNAQLAVDGAIASEAAVEATVATETLAAATAATEGTLAIMTLCVLQ